MRIYLYKELCDGSGRQVGARAGEFAGGGLSAGFAVQTGFDAGCGIFHLFCRRVIISSECSGTKRYEEGSRCRIWG